MPKQARIDVPDLFHHVMAQGIEGREIFRDESDREEESAGTVGSQQGCW